MRRCDFIAGLGSAAAWPLGAQAQSVFPVVGFIGGTAADPSTVLVDGFRKGLREASYVEGQNVTSSTTGWQANMVAYRG